MDKTLIKLNAIKKSYSEEYPVLVKMIDEIIEEVEFKNTVLADYLSELVILRGNDPFQADCIAKAKFKGTTEALDKLTVRGEDVNNTGFNPDNGDFMCHRQTLGSLEVWNINGKMCIAHHDDPIYITKEQAMKFFKLVELKA